MKNLFIIMMLLYASFLSGQIRNINENPFDDALRSEADKLLTEWMDTFSTYQCNNPNPALNGGILCPACARMHGRIGDAVLPLMYLAEKTGNNKYLHGAKRLMAWMENVHRPDGSWMNDVHVSDCYFTHIAFIFICCFVFVSCCFGSSEVNHFGLLLAPLLPLKLTSLLL